jgi:hypothetical protein
MLIRNGGDLPMEPKHERLVKRDDLRDATHLEIAVSYVKGGKNPFGSDSKPRGYYLHVTPVKKNERMVCHKMMLGRSELLLEVQHHNEGNLARAVDIAKSREEALISAVVMANKAA